MSSEGVQGDSHNFQSRPLQASSTATVADEAGIAEAMSTSNDYCSSSSLNSLVLHHGPVFLVLTRLLFSFVMVCCVARDCRRDVCLRHRFAGDHICAKRQLAAAAPKTRNIAPHTLAAQLRSCGVEESSPNPPEALAHGNGAMRSGISAR